MTERTPIYARLEDNRLVEWDERLRAVGAGAVYSEEVAQNNGWTFVNYDPVSPMVAEWPHVGFKPGYWWRWCEPDEETNDPDETSQRGRPVLTADTSDDCMTLDHEQWRL